MQSPETPQRDLEPSPAVNGEAVSGGSKGHGEMHPKRGTGIWLLIIAVLILAGLGFGYFVVNRQRATTSNELESSAKTASDAIPAVDVMKVRLGPDSRMISLPGQCRAWYETTIYARVSGYLKNWSVDIGDKVGAGQTLATIETPELDQQLAAGQAKMEAEQAKIKLAEANVHFSEVTLGRYKDAPKGMVSEVERDEREAEFLRSKAQLAAAKSDLTSAQAEVDRVRAMIAFQKVTAPFAGTITQRRVDLGDLVTAGSTSSTTSLFMLQQTDQIRVMVEVPESVSPNIKDGSEATATADEFPGREFVGRVARSSHSINDASKTLRVEVDIPNKDLTLLPGMFVRVNFKIQETHRPLVIPASAIAFRSEGPQVAVVASDGKVTFRNVKISRDLGDAIEIGEGLSSDDRVALNISNQITTGDVVAPNEIEEKTASVPTPVPAVSVNKPELSHAIER